MASGRSLLGKPVRRGGVIHLALEERRQTLTQHFDQLKTPDEIRVVFGPLEDVTSARLRILRTLVDRFRPVLVVIDTLLRFVGIDDANDYSKATEAMSPLIALARSTQTHIHVVHHARKSGGQHGAEVLGSTALAGSVDTVLSLSCDGDRRLISATGRDGVELERTVLTMDENGWVEAGVTNREANLQDMVGRVYRWLEDHGESSTKEQIRKGVGADGTAVVRALNRLVEDRQVTSSGRGVRGDPILYSVFGPKRGNMESETGPRGRPNRGRLAWKRCGNWRPS